MSELRTFRPAPVTHVQLTRVVHCCCRVCACVSVCCVALYPDGYIPAAATDLRVKVCACVAGRGGIRHAARCCRPSKTNFDRAAARDHCALANGSSAK